MTLVRLIGGPRHGRLFNVHEPLPSTIEVPRKEPRLFAGVRVLTTSDAFESMDNRPVRYRRQPGTDSYFFDE